VHGEAAYRRGDLFDKRRQLMEAWALEPDNIWADAARATARTAGYRTGSPRRNFCGRHAEARMVDREGLNIPDWVPPSVAEQARTLFNLEKGNEIVTVVRRLVTDPRMKRVWATLLSRKRQNYRPTNAYVHFAGPLLRSQFATLADSQQHRAMQSLFIYAVEFVSGALPDIAKSQLDGLRQPYLDMAARLREDIRRLRHLGIAKDLAALEDLAVECELRANLFLTNLKLTVVDRPGDDADTRHQRGYLAALGREVRNLFSDDDPQQNRSRPIPLSRTVATIASVALDRKITEQLVRGVRC
jgi:hypothetical protein